jgi:hypothetical protein
VVEHQLALAAPRLNGTSDLVWACHVGFLDENGRLTRRCRPQRVDTAVGQKGDAATLRQEGRNGHQEIADLVNFHEKAVTGRGKSARRTAPEEEGRCDRDDDKGCFEGRAEEGSACWVVIECLASGDTGGDDEVGRPFASLPRGS